jgi:hypothetical protein
MIAFYNERVDYRGGRSTSGAPAHPVVGLITAARRLEELDRISGGILGQDLLTARPADDLVAEGDSPRPAAARPRARVVDDEVDAIPTPRLRYAAVGHRTAAELSGPLRSSRRLPRTTSANAGAKLVFTVKPKWVV